MLLLSIDPGPTKSALILMDKTKPIWFDILPNEQVLKELNCLVYHNLAIEMIASYGMAVGAEVFETCVWIGRFIQEAKTPCTRIYRKDVKLTLCGQPTANDSNIRQAIIDRYGPGKEVAIGTKKSPGPLYGISKDIWAALGVGLTFLSKR